MNLFQNVKYGVSCREAAERYGVSVNRQGKALCPFHNDRHPSLYVADNHCFCFSCGAHGDVIDFAADFFDLPLYEAAQRLAADFGIDTDRPPTKKILEKRRQQTEAQQLTENERLCFSVLSDYARVLREWKLRYAPQPSDETVHARFTEACHKLDETEYYLDILCAGDSHERAEVVQQQMADGKLDRLQRRLEEIHKEELEDVYDRFRQADRDVSEQLGEPHPDERRSVLHKLHRTQEQPAAEKQNRSHKNEQEL